MGIDKLKLAIFISGRGSNMRSIMKACEDENLPAKIELVLSNRPDAKGLDFAKKNNVKKIEETNLRIAKLIKRRGELEGKLSSL